MWCEAKPGGEAIKKLCLILGVACIAIAAVSVHEQKFGFALWGALAGAWNLYLSQ